MATQQHVQAFLEARQKAQSNPELFATARQELLAYEQADVVSLFEERLHAGDDEGRCETIVGLMTLYGSAATGAVLRWIKDESPTVRWVICGCLHDGGDERAIPALLDRMQHDADCMVRGIAASALGATGTLEVLPHLHRTWQSDQEFDEMGYSPSGYAEEAMTSVLKRWVIRQIAGDPPKVFEEATSTGHASGKVTAEAIPILEENFHRTPRYAHVPMSAFGPGCASKLGLQTTLVAPFEIEVEYSDPTCAVGRIFIYSRIENWSEFDWSITTILDPTAMTAVPKS